MIVEREPGEGIPPSMVTMGDSLREIGRLIGEAAGKALAASMAIQKVVEVSEEERKRQQRYTSRRNRAPHPKVIR